MNVVCLSDWDRGGDCDGGVEISPDSPLRLDVSLLSPLVPGKFPDEGAWLPLAIRPGVPITPAVGKKALECLLLASGGEAGLSGPLYIWLTRLAAPGNWSLAGRERRLTRPRPMGMLGALSGSVWSNTLPSDV